jgi:phosphatidylglycerophosphate synthase
MTGRKIEREVENPIDDAIIHNICEPVSNILRSKSEKITPNMITSVGMIIGLMCIYFIYQGYYKTGFVLYWLCYIFDCLDGYYARKYDMITRFGDFFDHFRDIFVNLFVIILIFVRLKSKTMKELYLVSLIIIIIGMVTHFAAQELNTVSPDYNECLKVLRPLCKHKDYIHYTRYMGNGTFILVVSLYIVILSLNG